MLQDLNYIKKYLTNNLEFDFRGEEEEHPVPYRWSQFAFEYIIELAVATKVIGVQIILSFAPQFKTFDTKCRAAVPLDTTHADFV